MVYRFALYIESVPNRSSPPAVLLRESLRDHGKIRKRTLANLTHWPLHLVEHFRVLLCGGVAVASACEVMTIERSLPHGHVAAVSGTLRACGSGWFDAAPLRLRRLLAAMVVMRVVEPASKLATWRMRDGERAVTTVALSVGLEGLHWTGWARLRRGLNGAWRGVILPGQSVGPLRSDLDLGDRTLLRTGGVRV